MSNYSFKAISHNSGVRIAQSDKNICKQGVCRESCGFALRIHCVGYRSEIRESQPFGTGIDVDPCCIQYITQILLVK